ncbi:hypothetical protein [Botrimarina sp.]|uniref:hypothetical protein n=1 Tax=Botrimarina sp. TaxID=2795802 RepID=UPI0032EBC4D8
MAKKPWARFPTVSAGAEFLVMGYLMRRNIQTYKAPLNNAGYDLVCIHPDPRYKPSRRERSQIRVQVKSRIQSDCDRGFPVKAASLDAFDFLVVAFLNIGNFYRGKDGSEGMRPPEFYTLPASFVAEHHDASSTWEKVRLRPIANQIERFKDEAGFDLIAEALGIPKPTRKPASE